MVDFAAIGHVTNETIDRPNGEWRTAGGPVAYIVLTAKKLGKKVKTVTKVGDDLSSEQIAQLREIGLVNPEFGPKSPEYVGRNRR